MKELNQMISMGQDYPNLIRSLRGQTKCRALGNLRLHLTFGHKEPDEPTLDRRNELDFEREARERYEAKLGNLDTRLDEFVPQLHELLVRHFGHSCSFGVPGGRCRDERNARV